MRRAGLDYLDHVAITRHESFEAFEARRSGAAHPALSHAESPHHEFHYQPTDTLLLGRESAGVPDEVHARADARLRIPMRDGLRSLNIAVAAALVLGEALRQTGGFPGQRAPPGS